MHVNTAPIPTDRTRLTRSRHRGTDDRAALYAILDEGLLAHVAVVRDSVPIILPMLYARDGDDLLLHGSTGGGFFRDATAGLTVTVAVTLVDGFVAARSTFDSSMNYRSAMVIGTATPVVDPIEKERALLRLTEHVLPGRQSEVRPNTAKERASTSVLRIPLTEASVKVRAEGPGDPEAHDPTVWAGVLPVAMRALSPVAAAEFGGAEFSGADAPNGAAPPVSPSLAAVAERMNATMPPYA